MHIILELLLELIWLPFESWKNSTENSRVGTSPHEKQTLKIWMNFGATATVIIVIVYFIL